MEKRIRISLYLILLLMTAAQAEEASLPEYLTLQQALALVDESHPGVQLAARQTVTGHILRCQQYELLLNAPGLLQGSCGYWHFLTPLAQQKLLVMRRFLDVALADQRAARDSEAMSMAYVRQDRSKNRMQLGQRSELEALELDAIYQRARREFLVSESRQRISRSLLAIALNRPDRLPREVVPPDPAAVTIENRDDEQKLLRSIENNNPVLQRLQAGDDRPLEVLTRQYLRHVALEQLLSVTLLEAQQQENRVEKDYRDLYLDYSRSLYELEVKADLGDAMANQTAARLAQMETDYQLLMSLAVLDALRGRIPEFRDDE
ncbi:MAG: hypothetical protein ABFR19_03365 [Pseudomonadota bacterium]